MANINTLDTPAKETRSETSPTTGQDAPLLLEDQSPMKAESISIQPDTSQPPEQRSDSVTSPAEHGASAPLLLSDNQMAAESAEKVSDMQDLDKEMLPKQEPKLPIEENTRDFSENSTVTADSDSRPLQEDDDQTRVVPEGITTSSVPDLVATEENKQSLSESAAPNSNEERSSSEKEPARQPLLLLGESPDRTGEKEVDADLLPSAESAPPSTELAAEADSGHEAPTVTSSIKETTTPSASSPYGSDTVLVEGQSILLRTYVDEQGKWYETYPVLRSLSWMPKNQQEKFVRRWIPSQCTRLILQPNAAGYSSKTTHLNKEGLQELLAQIEKVKPSYLEKSSTTGNPTSSNPNIETPEREDSPKSSAAYLPLPNQPDHSNQPSGTEVQGLPTTLMPMAELLVSDQIIRTPIYTDESGTWFGTVPLTYNTKYGKGGYVGKFLRRLVGSDNVRNIQQETPSGKQGRLYTNEEGLRKLVKKLGKSLELIALPNKESRVVDSKSVEGTAVPPSPPSSSAKTGLPVSTGCRKVIIPIGKVKASLRLYTEGNETWMCATDIIKALNFNPTKGTARAIGNFVSATEMRDIDQPAGNSSRALVHVNLQSACKLIEGISAKKGKRFSRESFIEEVTKAIGQPAASHDIAQSMTGISASKPAPKFEEGYGATQITLAGVSIPTRTYTDNSGVWYNVSDLVLESGLKTSKTKVLMLNRLNKKDVRLILQPSPNGRRLMSHVNEEGLSSILPELEQIATERFGKQSPEKTITAGSSPVPSSETSPQSSIQQPGPADQTLDMVTIQVEGQPIQVKTYRDATGVWFSTREMLKASKYAHRHDGTKILGLIAGNENIRKILQRTPFGKREITHISEKGLEMLLKEINGKVIEGNGILGTTLPQNAIPDNPVLSTSMSNDALFTIPPGETSKEVPNGTPATRQEPSLQNKPASPYGLAVLNYKGTDVEIPTYVDDSGRWYCVYKLLQIAGRTTSSARSTTMKKAIKDGEIRIINQPTPKGRNNFSHLDEVGLNELLSELYGFQVAPEIKIVREGTPEKEKSHDDFLFSMEQLVGNKPRPTLSSTKKHSVFDEHRLGEKAPRPGDNSGVFTSLPVYIDQQKLLVKTYTDNHKTWYATPDMFELVEIYDKDKQKEFLAEILDKSDIQFIWQHYKDGLKLQPHVQTGALQTLVQALTKVANQARQKALSAISDRGEKPTSIPTAASVESHTGQVAQGASNTGFASSTQNSYHSGKVEATHHAGTPLNAGPLHAPQSPSTVSTIGAGRGNSNEKDIAMSLGGGILGSTSIDLFGKPVEVKTTTADNELWYNAVDIIVGFNAIEEAERKPTLKKGDLSHFVKAVVDAKNVKKLNQKITTQNAVRLMTHINAEGLEQLKLALLITRAGGKPTSPIPVQTQNLAKPVPSAPEPPTPKVAAPAVPGISQPMDTSPATPPASFLNPQPSYPSVAQAPRVNIPLTYGKENIYLLGTVLETRTVIDADGKWYAVDDLLERLGIPMGSPERSYIENNVRTGIFRPFWQSGSLGIQKLNHVNSNGLYEMLNAIEVLAQQRRPIG